tara:strand:+ start:7499 stop:7615 length:117 start_codon:yes stop_codon:yes gene_type:complete
MIKKYLSKMFINFWDNFLEWSFQKTENKLHKKNMKDKK